jgi:ribosome biogenesis GTPase A
MNEEEDVAYVILATVLGVKEEITTQEVRKALEEFLASKGGFEVLQVSCRKEKKRKKFDEKCLTLTTKKEDA